MWLKSEAIYLAIEITVSSQSLGEFSRKPIGEFMTGWALF